MPWFKFAQYDASIEQPLIRNAGEALGVTALLNLSDAYPEERLWRSSVHINTLGWIDRSWIQLQGRNGRSAAT